MNIGSIFLQLAADGAKLEPQVVAAAKKAGDAGAKTLGQRLKAGLTKENVFAGIGAATGTLAIGALKMGEAYDEAFDIIRTGTGATGEAFEALKGDFGNLIGSVPDDARLAAQVLADLNTRTGQTGDGLVSLSQTILDFSRITKTDAVANVRSATRLFGDWSIATENQAETMDKLLRVGQATGIGMDELMTTVVDFGAPMRLLGFEFEEAAALLAKWEKEGVNTGTMLSGLKFGVKTLAREGVAAADMGEALRGKIEAIGKSADPVGESIKLFGLRAGPDLAAAILEGRFATEDLVEVMNNGTDTIAGLTDETRDAGDWIKILGNRIGSVIGPMASGFGDLASTMGPLLYSLPLLSGGIGRLLAKMKVGTILRFAGALAMLGPKAVASIVKGIASTSAVTAVSQGIASTLTRAGNAAPVKSASGALGKVLGSTIGKAMSLAFAAIAVVEVINTYNQIRAGLNEQAEQIGTDIGNQIAKGTTESLQASRAAVAQGIEDLGGVLDLGIFTNEQRAALERQLAAIDAELAKRASSSGASVGTAIADGVAAGVARTSGGGSWEAAADAMGTALQTSLDSVVAAAKTKGGDAMEALAQGITDARDKPLSAFDRLKAMLKHQMTSTKEAARLAGQLTSAELAKGLKSKDPAVRAQAEATKLLIIERLRELARSGQPLGKKAMAELNAGIRSKNPAVRAAARAAKDAVTSELRKAQAPARNAGANAGIAFVRGILSRLPTFVQQILRTQLAKMGVTGFAAGSWSIPHDQIAVVHRREMIIPAAPAAAIRAGAAAVTAAGIVPAGGGGGPTYNIPVTLEGRLPVQTIRDISTEMRRLGEMGLLPSATAAPRYHVRGRRT
jgi:hypothetical protein